MMPGAHGAESVKLELFAIGEVMAEIRREPELGFRVGFAGDTFNTAVYCARQLGASGRVGYCTRVGLDPLSEAFLAMAAEEDLDVSHVARDQEHYIGIHTVSTDAVGERSFHYWRSSSAARRLFSSDDPMGVLPEARIILYRVLRLRSCIPRPADASSTICAPCVSAMAALSPSTRTTGRGYGRMRRRRAGSSVKCGRSPTSHCPRSMTRWLCSAMRARSRLSRASVLEAGARAPSNEGSADRFRPTSPKMRIPAFARLPGLSIRRLLETVSTVATLRHLLAVKMNDNAC